MQMLKEMKKKKKENKTTKHKSYAEVNNFKK